jgi:predicted nucleic acid-binding protein
VASFRVGTATAMCETRLSWFSATALLAERYRLTLCDVAQLELAQCRKLPLAALDGDLIKARKALGMTLFGT